MKIRNGFVSNSSSSSFIVMWDKKPESIEEVKNILFGNNKTWSYYDNFENTEVLSEVIFNDTKKASNLDIKRFIDNQYSFWGNSWYSKGYKYDVILLREYEKEYVKAVEEEEKLNIKLKKYTNQEKNRILRKRKLERVLDESSLDEYSKEYFNILERLDELKKITWRNESEKYNKLVTDSYNKFMKDYKDKFIVIYNYGDDNHTGSILEHGEVWDNLEYFRNSHH
jgi:hypothetical protein